MSSYKEKPGVCVCVFEITLVGKTYGGATWKQNPELADNLNRQRMAEAGKKEARGGCLMRVVRDHF